MVLSVAHKLTSGSACSRLVSIAVRLTGSNGMSISTAATHLIDTLSLFVNPFGNKAAGTPSSTAGSVMLTVLVTHPRKVVL